MEPIDSFDFNMSEIERSLQSAKLYFKSGDFRRAVKVLEEVTKKHPENYEAFVHLGAAYAQIQKYNQAIGALKKASEIKPNSSKIHYNLGQAYEAAGVPIEAWFEYQRALEIDPRYGLARGALTTLAHKLPNLMTKKIRLLT